MMGLTSLLSEPHAVYLTPEMWATAALIAGLRTASNKDRPARQDRGSLKNAVADIQGTIGELIACEHLLAPPRPLDCCPTASRLGWRRQSADKLARRP